jgi:hypothetical protein
MRFIKRKTYQNIISRGKYFPYLFRIIAASERGDEEATRSGLRPRFSCLGASPADSSSRVSVNRQMINCEAMVVIYILGNIDDYVLSLLLGHECEIAESDIDSLRSHVGDQDARNSEPLEHY